MAETPGIPAFNQVRQVHTPDGLDAGHIRYEPVEVMNVAAGAIGTTSVAWPYPVGISSATLFKIVNMNGGDFDTDSTSYEDHFWSYTDVEHPSLALTQALSVDDESLFIHPDVIAQLKLSVGDYISDGDDLVNDNHFHIVAIDRVTGEVTFETPSTVAINIGTLVHMHRFFVGRGPEKPYRLIPGVLRHWGDDTFDSALLAPGVPLKVAYKNNDDTVARSILGEVSILYGDA